MQQNITTAVNVQAYAFNQAIVHQSVFDGSIPEQPRTGRLRPPFLKQTRDPLHSALLWQWPSHRPHGFEAEHSRTGSLSGGVVDVVATVHQSVFERSIPVQPGTGRFRPPFLKQTSDP